MAKHLPDHHSPLLALGKKVLLWFIAPAALVVGVFYGLSTDGTRELILDAFFKSAKQQKEEADQKDREAGVRAVHSIGISTTVAPPPDPASADLTQEERNEKVRNLYAEAEKARARAPAAAPAPAAPAANSGYQSITRPSADYVLQRKSSTDVRIIASAGAIPAGTSVKDGNTEVAACPVTAPCTELSLKAPSKEGALRISDASGTLIAVINVNPTTLEFIRGTKAPPS